MHDHLFTQKPPQLLGEVQAFIASGGDPGVRDAGSGMTLVHLALEHLDVATLFFVVDSGSDMEATDASGLAPIHHAVDFDFDAANQAGVLPVLVWTRLLLVLGADPDRPTEAGKTASDLAASYGPEAVKLFKRCVSRWARRDLRPLTTVGG